MSRRLLALALALHLTGCAGPRLQFPSLEEGVTASATLIVPEGAGPFPAVALLHGCSGVRPNAYMWADFLKSHGYAALVLDSFRPRLVSEICTDFSRVSSAQQMRDAQAAFRYLSARREIDSARISVMGFSHGAGAALDAVERRRGLRDAAAPRFQGSIALYPGCQGRADSQPSYAAPVLILIGDRDDWTPAAACEALAGRLDRDSARVRLEVYPGARHSFDDLTAGGRLPYARNPNSPNGLGASVEGDARSLARAKRDVLHFLLGLERLHLPQGLPDGEKSAQQSQ